MKELILEKKDTHPLYIIDNNIDDSKVMFPQKLKEANEMLEKYPPPPEVLMHGYSEFEKEYGFEVNGILKRADADTKTFLVIIMDGPYEIHFKITTNPELLKKIVKSYWGETIKVHIRPKINSEKQFEYELMEVDIL